IIRYRTRDLTRLLAGTARSMRRMEKVTGRSDDMIILRGVNVFPTQIEEALMATPGLAPHFQIELSKPDRMDQMRVLCECADATVGGLAREAAAQQLAAQIKETVGISVQIDVGDVNSITRSEGKAVRIIDNRPKG
ncbi:MAG: phenylacetate--CoA ligase, partial [Sulfitobacter litoralis]|nr:phenylacetate--CoA ligase [Sulfitobacter litoralis]